MEEAWLLIALIAILCFGIFVQAAAGFAAGLLIVPALLWSGYSIPAAQSALLVATIPQNIWGVWALRESISVRRLIWPGISRTAFLPVGLWVLWNMETLSPETVRQIVGGVVLIVTLAIMFFQPLPRPSISPWWGVLAFPLSGFLQGVVGMGGPAMVFWIQAHDWSPRQMRGFLFAMYLISIVPAMVLLYVVFGDQIVRPGLIAAATTPALLVVTYLGMRVGDWLGQTRLRVATFALLLLMGLSGLAAPWLTPQPTEGSLATQPADLESRISSGRQ